MSPSTLCSWVQLIVRYLTVRGVDTTGLLRQARLSAEELQDPNARISMDAVQRLWALGAEASHDSCFGLEVGRTWHPTTFHALGYSAFAAATLREALVHVQRYSRVVSTGAGVELIDTGREVALRATIRHEGRSSKHGSSIEMAVQAGLAATTVLCRVACGGTVELERVTLIQHAVNIERLRDFFECPVVVGAAHNDLVFRSEVVDLPLPGSNPVLLQINDQALNRYLAQVESENVADRVRSALFRLLPFGRIGQAAVAATLNMSVRTLQRKLSEQNTSFSELLDGTRRQLAESYGKDRTLSMAEIAYLLGFSEPSSLSRAKRRWSNRDSRSS